DRAGNHRHHRTEARFPGAGAPGPAPAPAALPRAGAGHAGLRGAGARKDAGPDPALRAICQPGRVRRPLERQQHEDCASRGWRLDAQDLGHLLRARV
ncbi:MAG: hypothetical protein AVDCRST_MAG51-2594, partial [uncultured Ramlibacter sp.]